MFESVHGRRPSCSVPHTRAVWVCGGRRIGRHLVDGGILERLQVSKSRLYIKLRRSHDCFSFFVLGATFIRFRHPITLLRYQEKRIVNKMKVYIERNNLQLELIQNRKKCWLYSRLLLPSDWLNFTHQTHISKFRTQTASASFLTV